MWNLGQYRENLIFCQQLLNLSSNLKIRLHIYVTHIIVNICHTYTTFRFYWIDFYLKRFSFPILLFFTVKSPTLLKDRFLKKMLLKRVKTRRLFSRKSIGSKFSDSSFTLIENTFFYWKSRNFYHLSPKDPFFMLNTPIFIYNMSPKDTTENSFIFVTKRPFFLVNFVTERPLLFKCLMYVSLYKSCAPGRYIFFRS